MNHDIHERARKLITASCIEGISAGDREWLDDHLNACVQCSSEASAVAAAIRTFRAVPVMATAEAVGRAKTAARHRASELRAHRESAATLWIAAAISAASMILTSPYVWLAFAWFGRAIRVADPVWQIGFLMWWFLPATALAAVAAWRHTTSRTAHEEWAIERN